MSLSQSFTDSFTPKLLSTVREGYGFSQFRADALAGLTVAIVALPLSMAIAIASGATQYSLRQLTLDPALRPNLSVSTYESGHMVYTSPDVLKKFKADFKAFLVDQQRQERPAPAR